MLRRSWPALILFALLLPAQAAQNYYIIEKVIDGRTLQVRTLGPVILIGTDGAESSEGARAALQMLVGQMLRVEGEPAAAKVYLADGSLLNEKIATIAGSVTKEVGPPALNEQQIAQAIAIGTREKNKEQGLDMQDTGASWAQALSAMSAGANGYSNTATPSGGFSLVAYTPLTWLRQQAADAAKEYRTMAVSDVTSELLEPVVRIFVEPDTPAEVTARGMAGTSSVRHVVLRDEAKRVVIQPLSKDPVHREVSNAVGGRAVYEGLIVKFALDELKEIRGPRGDREFFITVIGSTGEEKDFKVKKKHFPRFPY